MAYNWQTDQYKSAVASKGGYFDNQGASATQNTGWNEAVDPSNWQSGGWYTNPNSGNVERWWSGSNTSGNSGSSNTSFSASTGSTGSTGNQTVSLPERPTIDLKSTYSDLYSSLGIADYKTQIEEKQQEILALRSQTDDAIALINENPWASSANRTGRIAKLEADYENKATLINAETALIQNQYESAMSELNTQMNLTTQQYGYDVANFDANLTQLNSLLDMGALDNASLSSLETIAAQTGMTSDMITSMISASKQSKVNPTLIQNTDDYGNVTLTLVDANTGNLINQQTLSGVATTSLKSSGKSGGSDYSDSEYAQLELTNAIEDYLTQNVSWASQYNPSATSESQYIWLDQFQNLYQQYASRAGLSFKEFLSMMQPYIKPSDYQQFANLYTSEE